LRFTTRRAESADARSFVEIARRAFSSYPPHARPKDTVAFVEHTHGPSNPAGRAWVAVAEENGAVVAHVSVIPFRFRRADGRTILGWQVSCYAVDLHLQGKGHGHALLEELLKKVREECPGDFVYTFPSPRSWPRFQKVGGRELAASPAHLFLPSFRRNEFHDAEGLRWRVAEADAETARRAVDAQVDAPPRTGAFVRDRAYFRWRYLDPPSAERYRFAIAEPEDGGGSVVIALADHSMRGQRFAILADACPDVLDSRLGTAVAAARAASAGRPLYLTTNVRWRGGPHALRVPRRFDPRPVATFLMPGCDEVAPELARAPILTGDWMSF
jgi:predicted N-acetyltransferase YhbS